MQREDLKYLSREQLECLICEWAVRYHDLYNKTLKFERDNSSLEEAVRSQRAKIDSLMKELQEEKGKTITISDGVITMRADMWDIVNENRKLKSENGELRKRLEKLESGICGSGVMIPVEYHTCDGKLWCNTGAFDEVLCRFYKDNERINNLEQKRVERGIETFKGIEAIKKINDELKAENDALKQRIKDLEDVCDGSCFSDGEDEKDKLIAELQDQHQQDCIRYNDMRTAYLVTLDELARLREQFGTG